MTGGSRPEPARSIATTGGRLALVLAVVVPLGGRAAAQTTADMAADPVDRELEVGRAADNGFRVRARIPLGATP